MAEATDYRDSSAPVNLLSEVMSPVGEARALPFAAYRDDALFAMEMERIYRGDWVAVCAERALAEPGACLSINIGGEPLVLVRGRDSTLRALSNVCRHRGTLLLEQGVGSLAEGRIECPYHAWTYDDTGAFRGAPFARGAAIDPVTHSLPSFPVEVWMGVVFVSLAEEPLPLSERLAGITPHLAEFDMQSFSLPAPLADPEVWTANWKLVVENGMESYHLFQVHANTLEKVTPTREAYYIEGSAEWTLTGGKIVQGGGGGFLERLLTSLFESGEANGDHYVLVSIPPSFVGVVTRESWDWLAAHPVSPTSTRVFTGSLTKAKPDIITKWITGGFVSAFIEEDRAICERVQKGMAARTSQGGRLVPLERVVVDFHHYLGARLLGEEPPPPYVERAP